MRGLTILNAYIVAFFDRYLKGEEQPLLQGPSADYPEVEIQANDMVTGVQRQPQVITSPNGETIVLDDFESGTLANWTSGCKGYGSWYVYTDGSTPPNPDGTGAAPNPVFEVPDPPQGHWAAVTDMNGPGSLIFYRDLQLDGSYWLDMTIFYRKSAVTPPFRRGGKLENKNAGSVRWNPHGLQLKMGRISSLKKEPATPTLYRGFGRERRAWNPHRPRRIHAEIQTISLRFAQGSRCINLNTEISTLPAPDYSISQTGSPFKIRANWFGKRLTLSGLPRKLSKPISRAVWISFKWTVLATIGAVIP